jgi:hypothetical protein
MVNPSSPSADPSRIVALAREDAAPTAVAKALLGMSPEATVRWDGDDGGPALLETDPASASAVAAKLLATGLFEAVDFDARRTVDDTGYTSNPNDPLFVSADLGWPLKGGVGTGLASLWPTLADAAPGASVPVAVIDSGFYDSHPDKPQWMANRWDFGSGDAKLAPDTPDLPGAYHGAYVASLIGATPNNGIGGTGAAWDTTVLCYKVANAQGVIQDSAVAAAIARAVTDGAQVINLSIGGPDYSTVMATAVARAHAAGVVVVAAAGNDSSQQAHYPASLPSVISVAAYGPDGAALAEGTYNSQVDIAAPGSQIAILAEDGTVRIGRGTSFAAPYVSATAALLRRHRPDLGPDAVADILFATARDVTSSGIGRDPYTGEGALDASAAISRVRAATGPVARLTVTPSGTATTADAPITVAVTGWDKAGHPVAGADRAQVAYSLQDGCTFPVGTVPSMRICTVTARLEGIVGTATVAVFDVSVLRQLELFGDPVPGATLSVVLPSGWPAGSVAVQWTQAGVAIPGAQGTAYTIAPETAAGQLLGASWSLTHAGLTVAGHVNALAVVRSLPAATTPPPTPVTPAVPVKPVKSVPKVTVKRSGRTVIVRVKASGVPRPAGNVSVKFGTTVKRTKLKASAKGVVKMRVPAKIRGKTKVKAVFHGSATVAKATSPAKRMTFR